MVDGVYYQYSKDHGGPMINLRFLYLAMASEIMPWAVYHDNGVTVFQDHMNGRMQPTSRVLWIVAGHIEGELWYH